MCCDGILWILAAGKKKHHDKNLQDSRVSITVLCCGSAAGTHGPVVFLLKEANKVNKLFTKKRMQETLGLPEGLCVLLNDSAYMGNVTWLKVVKVLAPALRKLPVFKDHPDWWILLTYDGFKSHVNVTEALEFFL